MSITNKITLRKNSSNEKQISELSEGELKNYKLLGRATGEGIGLCMFEAHKHCKDFADRVVGYRVIKDDHVAKMLTKMMGKEYMSVEFYEGKY